MNSTASPSERPKGTRRTYTREFKEEALRLARQPDIGFVKAARDLGVHVTVIRGWAKQLEREGSDAFRGHGHRTEAEGELARLRRENAILREERDILKKAATYFAKHHR